LTIDQGRQRLNAWLDAPLSRSERGAVAFVKKFVSTNKTGLQVLLMLVSVWGMWMMFHSPLIAVVVTVGIYVHELGHLWAMRSQGMDCHGIFFVPFFGAATVGNLQRTRSWERWAVAVMGPLFGLASALVPYLAYRLFFGATIYDYLWSWRSHPNPIVAHRILDFARSVEYIAGFNLINLLPLPILDGGRMIGEIIVPLRKRTAGALLLLLSVFSGWMFLKVGGVLLGALITFGLLLLWTRWNERRRGKPMRGADIAIAITVHIALFIGLGFIAGSMSSDAESLSRWLKDH
jgi:hypothetical protein